MCPLIVEAWEGLKSRAMILGVLCALVRSGAKGPDVTSLGGSRNQAL